MTGALRRLGLSTADAAITLAIVAWAVAEAATLDNPAPIGWRLAFAVVFTVAMASRIRWPGAALAVALTAFVIDLVFDVLPIQAVTPIQLLPLATYALASGGDDRRFAGFAAVAAVIMPPLLFAPLASDAPVTTRDVVSLLVVQIVAAGAGWSVRRRREEADRQAESLLAAGLEGDDLVREGVEEERARIARELRAIVARSLSAMDERLRGMETASRDGLAVIAMDLQTRAAGVMAELQRLLGVLPDRAPGVSVPASADASAAAARGRGWRVALTGSGTADDASTGAVLAAGRLVDEVLAGDPPPGAAPATVRADIRGDGVRLRISGRGAAPRSLEDPAARSSIRERVRLHGGRARLNRWRHGWSVEVTLPGAGVLRESWRAHALGDVVVVGTACLVVADDARAAGGAGPFTTAALGLLLFVMPLALRRRAPLAAVLVIGAGLLALQLGGVLPGLTRTPMIPALLGAGTAAMHIADTRVAFTAAAVVTASAVVVNLMQQPPGSPMTDTPIILFMFVMACAFGRVARSSMERVQDARAGEDALTAEHWRRLQRAVDDERRAVARDLHDVVAHGVSLVGVLAGGAATQAGRDPARARASLRSARRAVAQARAEVERLTAALGDDESAAEAVTTLDDVRALVAAARGGGQAVDYRVEVRHAARVPAGVAMSAYRIVQEALTNARKHAPGAETTVHLAERDNALLVEIRNGAAPVAEADGTRRGIAGMRERARLLGGDLCAAPEPDGGFAVRARLPVG